jgi:hypothetical protein
MLATENAYHARGLIAIMVCDDLWLHITRDAVQVATGSWLDIPHHDVGVKFYPPSGFLLLLPSPNLRDHVLASNDGLTIRRAKLQLLPWTCLAGAEAAKMAFKIRIFIECIPFHALVMMARQATIVLWSGSRTRMT